jgi:GNAT superfamily N-acetyltransferase
MLFLTTTAIDIDEELLNRCLVLTIDESREQTAAILSAQRQARTLDGLLMKARTDDVLAAHRAAQALLRPLAVVNPFAEALTFATDRVRLRRDHAKYLALIDSIALLHQQQRPIRQLSVARDQLSESGSARVLEYIEVTREDIALANRLAHEVLGRSLDELPPQTRRVLGLLCAHVDEQARMQGVARALVRFTRRQVREHTGLSQSQLAVHFDRLLALEYLLAHSGRNGQRFVYELAFDGDPQTVDRQLPGLLDVFGETGTTTKLPASTTELPVRFRPASGVLPATFPSTESTDTARPDAILSPALAASVKRPHLAENASIPRRNGSRAYTQRN